MDEAIHNLPEQEQEQETGTSQRKCGKRAKNKMPETVYTVNEVGEAGEPIEPPSVRAKFRNAVGVVARTWLEPTWPDCRKVLDSRKDFLWGELKKWF